MNRDSWSFKPLGISLCIGGACGVLGDTMAESVSAAALFALAHALQVLRDSDD